MDRIEKVSMAVNFIEENLTKKLDLGEVAKQIHYSKYHLHRVFADTTGLTIHDYIKRRQLTEAAKLLVFSDRPIIDIALMAGYKSQQAFTSIFTEMYKMPPNKYRENKKEEIPWNITFASKEDIPCWMELVRLVVDGFPYLNEEEYSEVLKQKIEAKQALILKDGKTAVGIMLFSGKNGSIDFMGTHPLYRKKGIPKAFLDKVMGELIKDREISITTYRDGDKADTGHRDVIKGLGFAEAELLVEYGYPTQKFILTEGRDRNREASSMGTGPLKEGTEA